MIRPFNFSIRSAIVGLGEAVSISTRPRGGRLPPLASDAVMAQPPALKSKEPPFGPGTLSQPPFSGNL
jgi:hypothetical protein